VRFLAKCLLILLLIILTNKIFIYSQYLVKTICISNTSTDHTHNSHTLTAPVVSLIYVYRYSNISAARDVSDAAPCCSSSSRGWADVDVVAVIVNDELRLRLPDRCADKFHQRIIIYTPVLNRRRQFVELDRWAASDAVERSWHTHKESGSRPEEQLHWQSD